MLVSLDLLDLLVIYGSTDYGWWPTAWNEHQPLNKRTTLGDATKVGERPSSATSSRTSTPTLEIYQHVQECSTNPSPLCQQ